MSELGELIRENRTKQDLTQKELGQLIGKSQQFISQLEQGLIVNIISSWSLLPQLSLILKLPIEKLVKSYIELNKKRYRVFYTAEQEIIDCLILEEKDTRYFGHFLKTVLKQLGFSSEDMTKPLQIQSESSGQIAKYYEGKNIPKDKTVYELMDFIGKKFRKRLLKTAIKYALTDRRQRLPNQDILLTDICEGSVGLVLKRLEVGISNSELAEEISTSETNITSLIYCTYQKGTTSKYMKKIIKKLASYFQIDKQSLINKFGEYLDAYKKREEIIKNL